MKNKILTHCKRKKFFYRFFMRKSPRSGVMSGLAWMSMYAASGPFALFMILVFSNFISSGIAFVAASIGVLLCGLPFYIYGLLLSALGLMQIFKSVCKKEIIYSSAGVLAALFPPLLGVALVPVMLCRKRFAGILFALAGTAFYVLNHFRYININFNIL